MPRPRPSRAVEVREALAKLLSLPAHQVVVRPEGGSRRLRIEAADHRFLATVLPAASPGRVDADARALLETTGAEPGVIPLVVVPYMNAAAHAVAAAAGVSWVDLSGNAHVVTPTLRLRVEGHANLHRQPGRPSSVFAPKSARVVRWLLMHPGAELGQREIARATDMSEGFVSRIAARLVAEQYVLRGASGGLWVRDHSLLLDAWRAEYRFERHRVRAGYVPARSGMDVARAVSAALGAAGIGHAATGLAATSRLTQITSFRLATLFVERWPDPFLAERLALDEPRRGVNLWLLLPDDPGVFQGSELRDGLVCVHPVQAYVDLKGHPAHLD